MTSYEKKARLEKINDRVLNIGLPLTFLLAASSFTFVFLYFDRSWYFELPIALFVALLLLVIGGIITFALSDILPNMILRTVDKDTKIRYDLAKHERSVNLEIIEKLTHIVYDELLSLYKAKQSTPFGQGLPEAPSKSDLFTPDFILDRIERGGDANDVFIQRFGDPRVYGSKFFDLRVAAKKNGNLPCLSCGTPVPLGLRRLEKEIKDNQVTLAKTPTNTMTVFPATWERGSFCPTQRAILCPECTRKAVAEMIEVPFCPKCNKALQGIDHITD